MGGWRGGGRADEEMRAVGVNVNVGVSVGGERGWRAEGVGGP
jgi:hypothetical protein